MRLDQEAAASSYGPVEAQLPPTKGRWIDGSRVFRTAHHSAAAAPATEAKQPFPHVMSESDCVVQQHSYAQAALDASYDSCVVQLLRQQLAQERLALQQQTRQRAQLYNDDSSHQPYSESTNVAAQCHPHPKGPGYQLHPAFLLGKLNAEPRLGHHGGASFCGGGGVLLPQHQLDGGHILGRGECSSALRLDAAADRGWQKHSGIKRRRDDISALSQKRVHVLLTPSPLEPCMYSGADRYCEGSAPTPIYM